MKIPRYITQITKEWFKEVSKTLSPGNCISIRRSEDTNVIDVDMDMVKEELEVHTTAANNGVTKTTSGNTDTFSADMTYIREHIGQTGSVTSVDGHSPDSSGAVSFGLTANKYVKTNGQGHLATSDTAPVVKVDNRTADDNGEISFGLTANQWMKTDGNGHIATTSDSPVVSVDGHNADSSGAVNFGLAVDKWVKTNGSGHLVTTTETPATLGNTTPQNISTTAGAVGTATTAARSDHIHALPSSVTDILGYVSSGIASSTLTMVTGVTWNATTDKIVVTRKQLVFAHGILTSVSDLANTEISTVTYNP